MKTEYPFTHNGQPAMLLFSDEPGPLELSELIFNDFGPTAHIIITGYKFDEKNMQLLVYFDEKFYKANGEILQHTTERTLNALPQESVEYFASLAITPPIAKRMEVNGFAIDRMQGRTLFDPVTGEFAPSPEPPTVPEQPE